MSLFPSGLLVRRNLLILKLSAAGAGSPETAVTLEQAGVGNSRIFRKPYSSPLHTTALPSITKGCMPSGVSPMIESRLKPRYPWPVSIRRLSSGPLEMVLASISATTAGSACPLQYASIEHIFYLPFCITDDHLCMIAYV